jgi:hypothetical protein
VLYWRTRWGRPRRDRPQSFHLRVRRVAVAAPLASALRSTIQVLGTPKGHARREVPIPTVLLDELAAQVEGPGRDDLVFAGTKGGGVLRGPVFRRAAFDRAWPASGSRDHIRRTNSGTRPRPWRSRLERT